MKEKRINITQGEFAATGEDDTVISTLLGSCVAVCLWDPVAKVGGMNHMLLAVTESKGNACNLAGVNAMEVLINDIVKKGGDRTRLKAKMFGGARMVTGLSDIGQKNADFATEFLRDEGIELTGSSVGGTMARNVRFWPTSGKALQRTTASEIVEKPTQPVVNDLELF